jgi:septum formation protein
MRKIVLASASPRRRELLGSLGLDFDSCVSGVEEDPIEGEIPAEHALRLAREKALAALVSPESFVIGADTIVIIDGEVLGKPQDRAHAVEMLRKLSGRTHRVITGFAVVRGGVVLVSRTIESSVLFKDISAKELEWYTRTPEPYDKAGGYAVQGIGAFFIREIHGSYTNVIGLPLAEVVEALEDLDAFRLEDLDCG